MLIWSRDIKISTSLSMFFISSYFSNARLYILIAILRLLFQSTALFTSAWAPFPKSLWNSIPLKSFANNFCSSISSFWSASIVDRIESFWMLIAFRLISFFFDNWDGFGVHLLLSILNFYLSSSNFLPFFLLSLSPLFVTFPFTHKSFFIWIFFITFD